MQHFQKTFGYGSKIKGYVKQKMLIPSDSVPKHFFGQAMLKPRHKQGTCETAAF